MKNEAVLFRMAMARLKVRRLRLFLTVLVSSLLFAVLIFILGVSSGIVAQYGKQSESVYGGKYYVLATKFANEAELRYSPRAIEVAKKLYMIDPAHNRDSNNSDPVQFETIGDQKRPYLAWGNKYTNAAILQLTAADVIDPKDPSVGVLSVNSLRPVNGSLQVLRGGKDPSLTGDKPASLFAEAYPQVVDRQIVDRYIKKSVNVDKDIIPILLTAPIARDVLQSQDAKVDDMVGRDFLVCYRDDGALKIINTLRFASDSESAASGFQLPIQNDGCQPVRQKDSKTLDANRNVGISRPVAFRIIGILPSTQMGIKAMSTLGLFTAPLPTSSEIPPMIPLQDLAGLNNNDILQIVPRTGGGGSVSQSKYFVFDDANHMIKYIDDHNCLAEQVNYCSNPQRPYELKELITIQKSNDEYAKFTRGILNPLIVVVVTLAVVILTSNFLRVIDDSRQEIGIYRAIGANDAQIVRLFSYYGCVVATLIAIISILTALISMVCLGMAVDGLFKRVINERFFADSSPVDFTISHIDLVSTVEIVALIYILVEAVLLCILASRRKSISNYLRIE